MKSNANLQLSIIQKILQFLGFRLLFFIIKFTVNYKKVPRRIHQHKYFAQNFIKIISFYILFFVYFAFSLPFFTKLLELELQMVLALVVDRFQLKPGFTYCIIFLIFYRLFLNFYLINSRKITFHHIYNKYLFFRNDTAIFSRREITNVKSMENIVYPFLFTFFQKKKDNISARVAHKI